MKTALRALAVSLMMVAFAGSSFAADPDYSLWNKILTKYYDPAKGFDYKGLKANDMATLNQLKANLGKVNVASLNKKEQQAFWMNYYNIYIVSTVVENYPLKSLRDLDGILPYGVFLKKSRVTLPGGAGTTSFKKLEDDTIREGFKDPRIHFAINCAARSCPPLRTEAYVGSRLDAQLDEQARKFLNGPNGVRLEQKDGKTIFHTTMIMKWFEDDFKKWGGGVVPFSQRYLNPDKQKQLVAAGKVTVEHDEYSWALNSR